MKSVLVPVATKRSLKNLSDVSKVLYNVHSKNLSYKSESVETNSKNSKNIFKYKINEFRDNQMGVQMISKTLHRQIFGNANQFNLAPEIIEACKKNLIKLGIDLKNSNAVPDVVLKLPTLRGNNIEDHFRSIAEEQLEPYQILLNTILNSKNFPLPPSQWTFREGWTQYNNDSSRKVDFPVEDVLVLDVEVCISAGNAPTLATAVGTQFWYSWVSPQLFRSTNNKVYSDCFPNDLIPLGTKRSKLIVGHNVSYDRARLKEQYFIEDTMVRFIDTMSLHICVSGVTSFQRSILKSKKTSSKDSSWMQKTSLNSLVEVYKLYCKGETHSKQSRDTFVNGSIKEVKDDFQNLMTYCSNDVIITREVFLKLFPKFLERFPHPVTLAGMLELGSSYLPINSNWKRYINESNLSYESSDIEIKKHLYKKANDACKFLIEEKYKDNIWMCEEDWKVEELKMKKRPLSNEKNNVNISKFNFLDDDKYIQKNAKYYEKFEDLYKMKAFLPARRPFLPGYPAWYRKLCKKIPSNKETQCDWSSGPTEIGSSMHIVPKLLSLCWEGYPLHFKKNQGWGFLVPLNGNSKLKSVYQENSLNLPETTKESNGCLETISGAKIKGLYMDTFKRSDNLYRNISKKSNFVMLPHHKGLACRVGNPLSKEFLNKFSKNISSCNNDKSAEIIFRLSGMMSYWKNNRDRIANQFVVWFPSDKENKIQFQHGAICPQILVCGTLTRRALEPTWMTASNSQNDRIGSELRAMIQTPKSYKIIGGDVDSQELWISSLLGDAYSVGVHGASPLGWMTLSGSKISGTDMHSITANSVGITRDNAKVLNYARIYGAGLNFAQVLLKQFNRSISDSEAKIRATKMFSITKGRKIYEIKKKYRAQCKKICFSRYEASKLASVTKCGLDEMFYKPYWSGGTESAMFNCLEEIASRKKPKTPFLSGRLSQPLEGDDDIEQRFFPTRVNWVVQSGAVDFLHLMIVSMRWLMGSKVRFCLSFHDELRYLVKEEWAYKAALAMHVTNLLSRSFCSSRLGLNDLPMSVAFFSSVEIDSVLRKECTMDCKTPSNPYGLEKGYGIEHGESLCIQKAIEKSGGGDLTQWGWIK